MSKTKPSSSSSKKANNGSTKSSSHKSSTHHQSSKTSSKTSGSSTEREERVEKYVQDGRDHRSYAVQEYDPYQEAAKGQHREQLKEVVYKKY